MAAYTSSDEFDLERRVWFTNETPPYDFYKGLASPVKSPFWKWFLGSTNIEYNVPHKVFSEADGGYVHKDDFDEVFLKMTNGQVSKNYGPKTSNDINDPNFNPTYHRMEIDGCVMPEFDLMLHEVYRYLETLYPDHPDEHYLLTPNEFNDTVLAAGDMINYTPDVKFFDKVAETLAAEISETDIEDESAKIKIRNLLNNSFRRKLYGSKAGYRMFANDIFQICTIFPVATYLPIKPVDPAVIAMEKATINNQGVLDALNMTKKDYKAYSRQHNRTIDTYSELYYRKFRLVDWDGQNSAYLQKADENTYLHGISIPGNENRLYEYPNTDDASAVLDDTRLGAVIKNSLDDSGITYVNSISDGIFETTLAKSVNEDSVTAFEDVSATKEIHYVTTSHNNAVLYRICKVYDKIENILELLKNDPNSDAVYENILVSHNLHFSKTSDDLINFMEAFYRAEKLQGTDPANVLPLIAPSDLKVIINPYVEGTVLLEPSKSISYYPDTIPNFKVIYDENGESTGNITVDEDVLVDNLDIFGKFLGDSDISTTNTNNTLNYLYYICGFTKGSLTGELNEENSIPVKELPYVAEDNRYGIVINTITNKKVVLFGNLKVDYRLEGTSYIPNIVHFNITHIPQIKPDSLLDAIYDDYRDIVEAKKVIREECDRRFKIIGMTDNGCEDIIKLFNISNETIKEISSTDELGASSFGRTAAGIYYYKTYNNIDIEIGSSINLTDAQILSLYKSFTGFDYTDYIELYLENKLYDETLDGYRANREYLYELASYTSDRSLDESDWPVYERSTIRPDCSFDKIIQVTGTPSDPLFSRTSFNDGILTELSLGNLNILPIIDNRKETIRHYDYHMEDEGKDLIEGKYDSYEYSPGNYIYWPIESYYKTVVHPSKSVSLLNGTEVRVNYNLQTYSYITKNNYTDDTSFADWLAGQDISTNPEPVRNITISPVTTTPIKIESVIDISKEETRNTIYFESEVAREQFKTLSIGDTVYGPTIDSDNAAVYITSIGYNSVTVNREFTQSGTYIFTYNCRMNITKEDEENNMSRYKKNLDNYNVYSIINPFDHGLWGSDSFPNASNAILESLPDVSFYKPYNYIAKGGSQVNSFLEVMNKIHPKRFINDPFIRVPSTIKFMNDLFVELNLTRIIPTSTRSGSTQALMSVDWLDYISNSLKDISRATDKANVGVNLMMETDSSGYYTMASNRIYTDPKVQLKFITMNFKGIQPMWNNYPMDSDNEWTVPAYAQIGTGGSGRFAWFTSPSDVTYPNIWGNNVYDSTNISADDVVTLNANNGNFKKRSTWGNDDGVDDIDTAGNSRFRSVEKPLFEIPLGEYDIQTRYVPTSNQAIARACTTIQSSFYAQTFNKITKYMEADTSPENGDVTSMPVVLNTTNIFSDAPIEYLSDIPTTSKLNYIGAWKPTLNEENVIKTIDYDSAALKNIGDYVVITEETILANIGEDLSTKKFKDHTIFIKLPDTDEYCLYEPVFMGVFNNNLRSIDSSGPRDIKEELIYHTLYGLGYDVSDLSRVMDSISNITYSAENRNKIFWFLVASLPDNSFTDSAIKTNSIVGLVTPNFMSNNIKDYRYILFNRGYYTATLPIVKPGNIIENNYDIAIGNAKNTIEELSLDKYVTLRNNVAYTNIGKRTISVIQNNNYIYKSDESLYVTETNPTEKGYINLGTLEVLSQRVLSNMSSGYFYRYIGESVNIEPGYIINIANEDTNPSIYHSQSTTFDLNKGITEITLPRKCIAEGSYNFDYIIDAGVTCTGYLYGTSVSNEVSYKPTQDEELSGVVYDKIENSNFDIITSNEVTFKATRAAIYKDEVNDAFYTYTDSYKDPLTGEFLTFDKLKKVAIKFEEQKYFKNTTHLSGVYKTTYSQTSGSNEIVETPTLSEITDIGDFNTNLISSNDRILRITPMDLRSVYTANLEPVFYSKYYDVDATIRGLDKDGNLVLSYDNTSTDPVEKLNFNNTLMSIIPVEKEFDNATQNYITTIPDDKFIKFEGDDEVRAPRLYKDSIEYKRSIISDAKAISSDDYEFKYFKNLLVLKAAIDPYKPNKLIQSDTDSGQFEYATQYLQKGDNPVAGLRLVTGSEDELFSNLKISYSGQPLPEEGTTFVKAYYDSVSATFICIDSSNKVGFATNVYLPADNTVNLDYFDNLYVRKGDGNTVSFTNQLSIKEVSCDSKNWYFTIKDAGSTSVYELSVAYTEISGHIYLTESYSDYKTYVDTEEGIIQLESSEFITTRNENNELENSTAYAKEEDLSIKSFSTTDGTFDISPYASKPVEGKSISGNGFFAKDPKSDWSVYIFGRDLFIKSPIYLVDENGNYTDSLSTGFYWKKARVPLLNERSALVYSNILSSQGENGVWENAAGIRDSLMTGYANLKDVAKFITKGEDGKYYFKYTNSNNETVVHNIANDIPGLNVIGSDVEAHEFIQFIAREFGNAAQRPSLEDMYEKYYPYYLIVSNLVPMPWFDVTATNENLGIGIEGFLKSLDNAGNTKYYYYDPTTAKFVVSSSVPTIDKDNAATYREYLRAYKSRATNKYEITYYGIGPYTPAKILDSETNEEITLDDIHGADLTFSTVKQFSCFSESDSSWYVEYISNLVTYGYLEDETSEVCAGDVNNVIFTKDQILFITEGGSIAAIDKRNTYKTSDLKNTNNWKPASLPDGLSYSYIKRSSTIMKTIKYGEDKTFELAAKYTTFNRPIYRIDSVYYDGNDVILGGAINSRQNIESTWELDFPEDGAERSRSSRASTAGQYYLSKCVQKAMFYFKETPFILHSDNGGKAFTFATIPVDLPGYVVKPSETPKVVTDGSRTIPGGPILISGRVTGFNGGNVTNGTMYTNLVKSLTSSSNNADMIVYDNISTSKHIDDSNKTDSSLDNYKSYLGLTVSGIIFKAPKTYQFLLTRIGDTDYKYVLETTTNIYDEPDFTSLHYFEDNKVRSNAKAYKVAYPTFTLFVDPDNYLIKLSSNEAIDFSCSIKEVSPSEITFIKDIINNEDGQFKNPFDVLVAFETRSAIDIETQKQCINTDYLTDYFDEYNKCLIKTVKEVPNNSTADAMYSYRETLNDELLSQDSYGYKAVSEDTTHKFYEYDTSDITGETLYSVKNYKNSNDAQIYICTNNGVYINKSNGIVNELTFYDIVKSDIFSSDLLVKAAKPVYSSVEKAKEDGDLRETDNKLKSYFDASKIITINRNYQLEPFSDVFTNPENLEVITKGTYISKTDNNLVLSSTNPTNLTIGESITDFSLDNLTQTGKVYYKYSPVEELTIADGDYVYKNPEGILTIEESKAGSSVSYSYNITIEDILNMPNDSCIGYKGPMRPLIKKDSYIVANTDGSYTVEETKPASGIEVSEVTSLEPSVLEEITNPEVDSYQRTYEGPDYKIVKNCYVVKLPGKSLLQSNFQYTGSERDDILAAINIMNKSYSKYTGENYVIKQNSYILNEDGQIKFTDEKPLDDNGMFDIIDIQKIMDVPENTYTQYTGELRTINKGSYIINIDGTHYVSTANPDDLTSAGSIDINISLNELLSLFNNLRDRTYATVSGSGNRTLVSTNYYILNKDGTLIAKPNTIYGLNRVDSTAVTISKANFAALPNNSCQPYEIESPITVEKDDVLTFDEGTGEFKLLKSNTLSINTNSANGTIGYLAALTNEKSGYRNTTSSAQAIIPNNRTYYKDNGVVKYLPYVIDREISSINIGTVFSSAEGYGVKMNANQTIPARYFVYNYGSGPVISSSLPGDYQFMTNRGNYTAYYDAFQQGGSIFSRIINASGVMPTYSMFNWTGSAKVLIYSGTTISKSGSSFSGLRGENWTAGTQGNTYSSYSAFINACNNTTFAFSKAIWSWGWWDDDPEYIKIPYEGYITYTGPTLYVYPGDVVNTATGGTSLVNAINSFDYRSFNGLSTYGFYTLRNAYSIGAGTCLVKQNGNISALSLPISDKTYSSSYNTSDVNAINSLHPSYYATYTGPTMTVEPNQEVLKLNGKLNWLPSTTDFTYGLNYIKSNPAMLYNGSTVIINKQGYFANKEGTSSIEENPILGYYHIDDTSRISIESLTKIYSYNTPPNYQGVYSIFTGDLINLAEGTCITKRYGSIYITPSLASAKLPRIAPITAIDFNMRLPDNSACLFNGNTFYFYKDSYIINEDGVISITQKSQLKDVGTIDTFNINDIYALERNTYKKYIGADYTLLKDSYIVRDGKASTIEANFPPTVMEEPLNDFDMNVLKTSVGNYQYEIGTDLELTEGTFYTRSGTDIIASANSDSLFKYSSFDSFSLDNIQPKNWCRKYIGEDIYIPTNTTIVYDNAWHVVSSRDDALTYSNFLGLLRNIISDTSNACKFTGASGYIIHKNDYITYYNDDFIIGAEIPECVENNEALYTNPITGTNFDEFLASFMDINLDTYYIQYTGEPVTIKKGMYISRDEGNYTYEEVNGYKDYLGEVTLPQYATDDDKMSLINNILLMEDNSYYKYVGDTLSLRSDKLYFTRDQSGIVLTNSAPDGISSLTRLSTTGSVMRDLSILASESGIGYYILIESVNATAIIEKDSFIIKSNGIISVTTEEPVFYGYTNKSELSEEELFSSILTLKDKEFYQYNGEDIVIPTNAYITKKDGVFSITDNVITRLLPTEETIENIIGIVTKLEDNTCIQYIGNSVSIEQGKYLTKIDNDYYILDDTLEEKPVVNEENPEEAMEANNHDTFDIGALADMKIGTCYQYTGDTFSIDSGTYIVTDNGETSIKETPPLVTISDISLKELSVAENGVCFQYVGKNISMYDMGLTLKTSLLDAADKSVLDELFYRDSVDKDRLDMETKYIERDTIRTSSLFEDFDERFELYNIGNSSDKYYFDKKAGYFPLKKLRYMNFTAKFGYHVNQAPVMYTKSSMHDISDVNATSLPNAVTNIYLQQRGYGGTRLRSEEKNSWIDELPWELDSDAFQESHLTNKFGENITLCDSLGNELIANRGEYPVTNNETITVVTEDIKEGDSKDITLSSFEGLEVKYSTIKIYRPNASRKFIWTTQDSVYVNPYEKAGSQQEITNVFLVYPSELTFVTANTVKFEVSLDGKTYTATNDFRINAKGTAAIYTVPAEVTSYPSYLKIIADGFEKVLTIDYSAGTNKVYSSIVPAYYTLFEDTYTIISNNGEMFYALDSAKVHLQNTTREPTLVEETSGKPINLPVFYIGTPKTYLLYDAGFTDDSMFSASDWRSHLRKESYIDDVCVTDFIHCKMDGSDLVCTYTNGAYTFTFDRNTLVEETPTAAYLTITSGKFVVTDNSSITLKAVITDDSEGLYVSGARGPIYMRTPSYPTFKDLILNKQFIIKTYDDLYNASSIKGGHDDIIDTTFSTIETNKVTFTDKLPIEGLNDGESHFIRIEVLTQKTVPTTNMNCFSNDYEELSLSDIEIFPPDRVYFNPKGYPSAPVTINNRIYNSENNIYYTNVEFTNNNGAVIRECDESGKFIKYIVVDGEAERRQISAINDDNVNDTFVPNRPNYLSCKDWFNGEYYIKDNESNPFWQVINLTSQFDSITQSWNQVLSLNKFEKVGKAIKQVKVDDEEAYLKLSKASFAEVIDDEIRQYYNCDYLDLFEGVIRFIVTEPTAEMYDSTNGISQIIKYGICADNTIKDTFHPSSNGSLAQVNLPGYLQSSYTVNSRKNYANPNETDSAIVEVTELGIFNKSHVLLAYAVFPPIEYRSDTQHVSFTSFIKYGTCSDEEEEKEATT